MVRLRPMLSSSRPMDSSHPGIRRFSAEGVWCVAKEAAARILASERKASRFQLEAVSAKEEAANVMVRLKQSMDFTVKALCRRIYEAEKTSAIQSRRIEELESQLTEAEDIVVNLRAQKQRALEECENRHVTRQQWDKQNEHKSVPIHTSDSQRTEALGCSSIKEMNTNGELNRLPRQDNEMPSTTSDSSVLIDNLVLDELELPSTTPRCNKTDRCHSTQQISEIEDSLFDGHEFHLGNRGYRCSVVNELNATSGKEQPSDVFSAMEKYTDNGINDGNGKLSVDTVSVNCDFDRRNVDRTFYRFFTRKRRNDSQCRTLDKLNTSSSDQQLVADPHLNKPYPQILPSQCADVAESYGKFSVSVVEDCIDESVPNLCWVSTRSNKDSNIELKERMGILTGEIRSTNMDETKFQALLSCRPTIISQTLRNDSSSSPSASDVDNHERTVGSDDTNEGTALAQIGDTYSFVRELGMLTAEMVTRTSVLESPKKCSQIANGLHDVAAMEERVTHFEVSPQASHGTDVACEPFLAPTNNRVLKYTFQRKRKREILANMTGNIVEENTELSCIIEDNVRESKSCLKKPRKRRITSGTVHPSRYSRRLLRVARQHIALSRRRLI